MKFSTAVRSGITLWAAPFAILLTLFYYFAGSSVPLDSYLGYAPSLVAEPLRATYALAYAIAASLAVWESGRVRRDGVFLLAPARSRFRVAANVIWPTVTISWLVVLLPPAISLVRTGTMPTAVSLRLPLVALLLCVAHTIIGFGIGLRVSRVIAAPLVAVTIWVLVAFSRTVQPYWIRHVSGQFGSFGFSEIPSIITLLPPLFLAGGIATGVILLWLPLRDRRVPRVLACVIAVAGMSVAYSVSNSWPHTPPLVVGQAATTCLGTNPRVCMPEVTAGNLAEVRRDVVAVMADLRKSGIDANPSLVTDRMLDGRKQKSSTSHTWYLDLSAADRSKAVRYETMRSVVKFPCASPDPFAQMVALRWAASVTGQGDVYDKNSKRTVTGSAATKTEQQIRTVVADVLTEPIAAQANWFKRTLTLGCSGSQS